MWHTVSSIPWAALLGSAELSVHCLFIGSSLSVKCSAWCWHLHFIGIPDCVYMLHTDSAGTGNLLSPFPDQRAAAAWYLMDNMCNTSKPRTPIYAKVRCFTAAGLHAVAAPAQPGRMGAGAWKLMHAHRCCSSSTLILQAANTRQALPSLPSLKAIMPPRYATYAWCSCTPDTSHRLCLWIDINGLSMT